MRFQFAGMACTKTLSDAIKKRDYVLEISVYSFLLDFYVFVLLESLITGCLISLYVKLHF